MITTFGWFGYELPMKERCALIKQAGFDGLTLWWSDDLGDSEYRSNPELARNAGLYVENIHTPYEHINNLWLDNLAGESLTDLYVSLVNDCAEYDIPTMVCHLSYKNSPPPFNELGLNRVKRIIDRAETRGVNVAFENLRRLDYLEYVLSHVNSPRAGFCYDSGHHNSFTPNEDLLPKYGSRLFALHLHDNDGTDDQHLLPFDGTLDWAVAMRGIEQAGYTGAVALEVMNKGHEALSPDEFLHLAYERAKKLEALLHSEVGAK